MTADDKNIKNTNLESDEKHPYHNQPIKSRDVHVYSNPINPTKKYDIPTAFDTGLMSRNILWLRLPWVFSTGVMVVAILAYFTVHEWQPVAFTETVLGIIVGGTATSAGITIFV